VVLSSSSSVSGVGVHRTYLRLPNPASASSISPPFCFSADAFILPTNSPDDEGRHAETPLAAATPNFLATQVWPSARAAATVIEQRSDPSWSICEFGCGPGLPSIVAAATRATGTCSTGSADGGASVIATDYDDFALRLVDAAAREQGLESILSTQVFDLTCTETELPKADLFVMSDVFECSEVAVGAAKQTLRALDLGKRAWIFAQSDRAQREIYRAHLNDLLQESGRIAVEWTEMARQRVEDYADEPLMLFDVDETKVEYC